MSRALAAYPSPPAAPQAPAPQAALAAAESALREAAFVLALARRVRQAIEADGLIRPASPCR